MDTTLSLLLLMYTAVLSAWTDSEDQRMHPGLRRTERSVQDYGQQTDAKFWIIGAQNTLQHHLELKKNENIAKNIILFLGDGMSIPTLAASRIYQGQQDNQDGESSQLSFEKFPYTGLSKTYCVDSQVADSACSATAYLCGVKANHGTIGVTAAVQKGNCSTMNDPNNHVSSILAWAQDAGKRTGVVTTTRVTHASPAGSFAHTAHRDWEADSSVVHDGEDPTVCTDIATQLVKHLPGRDINVILGGGRYEFLPNTTVDEEGDRGHRLDEVDLIKAWQSDQQAKGRTAKYVWNRDGLLSVDPTKTDYLLGLFEAGHTKYNLDRDKKADPTLAEMTARAIEMLEKEANGFFLFVEGGRIDHAHHDTRAHKALDETVQFAQAIEMAVNMTDSKDTLIVVTSDHAHTMSIAGYPARGTPILGMPEKSDMDDMPYSTLSYANGPGYKRATVNGSRYNMANDTTEDKDYKFPGLVPMKSETHGGDDVAVFASGPWSHLFTGVFEQNFIPHAMAYASCIGDGARVCDARREGERGH